MSRPSGRAARRTVPMPQHELISTAVLALARQLHLDLPERELAEHAHRTLSELLPGRLVVLRLDQGDEGRLVEAPPGVTLRPGALAGPWIIKRSSLAKTRLDGAALDSGRVRVADSLEPVVAGASRGFGIPLVASGQIYGVLDVAYAAGAPAADVDADEQLLIPVANQLAVALRNARLHREGAFLRSYLGKVIDHAGALILGVDPHWRITVYNKALSTLTGYAPEEVLGTDVRTWLPESQGARLIRLVLDARAGGTPEPIDLEQRTKDGRRVRTIWTVTAVAPAGKVEAVVAVGQDVTQLRSLERQVIQAEKLATLGQLAAGVVHELNNPLTQVMVYAQFLLRKLEAAPVAARGPFGEPDAQKLRRILEGAERILSFSRELVEYARPAGAELDVLSLNDVVREALGFCEHLLRKHDLFASCSLEDDLPPLYAVRGQLQQVIINLVTNAVHALGPQGGRVSVRTFRAADDARGGVRLGLEILDDGRGIEARDLPHIFEPFFTTKGDGQGTGLGLSIVQGIVERHRGSIQVASKLGEGSVFTLILPTGHTP